MSKNKLNHSQRILNRRFPPSYQLGGNLFKEKTSLAPIAAARPAPQEKPY
jgi:hypothetical protein